MLKSHFLLVIVARSVFATLMALMFTKSNAFHSKSITSLSLIHLRLFENCSSRLPNINNDFDALHVLQIRVMNTGASKNNLTLSSTTNWIHLVSETDFFFSSPIKPFPGGKLTRWPINGYVIGDTTV